MPPATRRSRLRKRDELEACIASGDAESLLDELHKTLVGTGARRTLMPVPARRARCKVILQHVSLAKINAVDYHELLRQIDKRGQIFDALSKLLVNRGGSSSDPVYWSLLRIAPQFGALERQLRALLPVPTSEMIRQHDRCAVCLAANVRPKKQCVKLVCGHIFHFQCIAKVYSCPICRQNLYLSMLNHHYHPSAAPSPAIYWFH